MDIEPQPASAPTSKADDAVAYTINGIRFELPARYQPCNLIGQGAYGIVISAMDKVLNKKVAVKKIPNAFTNLRDTKRTLREIKLLRHFKHDNIISIIDILKPKSRETFQDVYIVTEFMETDLQKVLLSSQTLTDDHFQYILYQILRGLKYLHSGSVLHRDLKPSNLLINGDCFLKIADFGLARIEEEDGGMMTEYVATRWYRAPEVILSWKEYDKSIDIWSVGCIFAEMMLRKPLFQGKDYINQINRIVEVLGTPTEEDICAIHNDKARQYIRSLGNKEKISWTKIFPNANPLGLKLLERMLVFNPYKRITVDEALNHPYLSFHHDEEDEPTFSDPFSFEFEKHDLEKEAYQELIYREMLQYHSEETAPK